MAWIIIKNNRIAEKANQTLLKEGGGGGCVSLQVQRCRIYFAKSGTTDMFTKEMFSLSDCYAD